MGREGQREREKKRENQKFVRNLVTKDSRFDSIEAYPLCKSNSPRRDRRIKPSSSATDRFLGARTQTLLLFTTGKI